MQQKPYDARESNRNPGTGLRRLLADWHFMENKPQATTLGLLRFSLFPAIAVGLLAVDAKFQALAWHLGGRLELAELATVGRLLGSLAAPVVTASLFAYPIARLYSRNALILSAAAVFPVFLCSIPDLREANSEIMLILGVQLFSLFSWLLIGTSLVRKILRGSRLCLIQERPQVEIDVDMGLQSRRPAHALSLSLCLILAISLFVMLERAQFAVFDLAFLSSRRDFQLAGIVFGAVAVPFCLAVLFAYPVTKAFGRRAPLFAILIGAPTSVHWATGQDFDSAWLDAAFTLVGLCLFLSLPALAFVLQRKWGCSHLEIETDPPIQEGDRMSTVRATRLGRTTV